VASAGASSSRDSISRARFEMTLEAVKNMLLVVTAEGFVDAASTKTGQDVWALTWTIIDSVCPAVRPSLQEVCPNTGGTATTTTKDSTAAMYPDPSPMGGRSQRSPTLGDLQEQLR